MAEGRSVQHRARRIPMDFWKRPQCNRYARLARSFNIVQTMENFFGCSFGRIRSTDTHHVTHSAFAPPVSQLLILIAFYQLLFVLVFAFGWNQPSRSTIAIFGAASTLVFALGLLARRRAHQRAVGDMRLEMDNSTDSPLNQLTGKLVFSRQSNEAARPLKVSLSLYEKRDWQYCSLLGSSSSPRRRPKGTSSLPYD